MLLKKQTVWLLTMLSLVVVLSVYYITSPEQKQNELAAVEEKTNEKEQTEATSNDDVSAEEKDAEIITNAASDEAFETLRMELEDERSRMKEELSETIASTELPAEERSKAKEQMDELNEIAQKELLLETLIKSMDYEDVLVRADSDNVLITVKSDKQSKAAANEIIQMVRSEVGPLQAVVEFQPSK
jgi:stage III sporulation protein AH